MAHMPKNSGIPEPWPPVLPGIIPVEITFPSIDLDDSEEEEPEKEDIKWRPVSELNTHQSVNGRRLYH
jgi:hypothetical protein